MTAGWERRLVSITDRSDLGSWKTATIRDLRYDFAKLEAWLRNSEEIQITKHNKHVATLFKIPRGVGFQRKSQGKFPTERSVQAMETASVVLSS